MNVAGGRHFNRGQRAFFFALAYMGWFLGPTTFILFRNALAIGPSYCDRTLCGSWSWIGASSGFWVSCGEVV